MPETVNGVAFGILAVMCVGGALGMLATKNIVHAAFWLLEVSVAAAGVFLLLSADYVALVQLLVYAVAVAVLMIFSIMITLRRLEDAIRPRDFSAIAATLATLFCALMIYALRGFHAPAGQKLPAVAPDIAAFGALLFAAKGWALPFEIASLILTAALVGAVWWTREGEK
ncbi:MAG TPA: NADH-quinone oxidoreductase subunit J [Coriobacteriia bacterium]